MGDGPNVELTGRTALVTGGASGIGRTTCLAFADAGVRVVAVDLGGRAEAVVADIRAAGGDAIAVDLDLSDTAAIEPAFERMTEQSGGVDILVNCAGIRGDHQRLLDVDLELWNQVFRVNVTAPMLLTQLVAVDLINRDRPGHVVNIVSAAAHAAGYAPAYSSSKAALVQLTRSAAGQLGRHGIRVNAVAPGLVDTPGVETLSDLESAVQRGGVAANPLEHLTKPEEISEVVLFLCRSTGASITGQVIHVNAGAMMF